MKKSNSTVLGTLILAILLLGASNLLFVTPFYPSSPSSFGQHPQTSLSPPTSQSGNGYPTDLTESVSGWHANATMWANNTFSSYQQRNSPSFSEPTPTGYSRIWQTITISSLTATQDVREVQYASSSINSLIANDTGAGTYSQLAMMFRLVDKVNLTSIWIYYTSAGTANLNIANSSTNSGDKTPSGRPTIATYALPAASKGWHEVKPSDAITLQAGFYYWVIINATSSGGALVDWYYIADVGSTEDNKCASAYQGAWYDETILHNVGGKPYLNLMLMLDVIPVSLADPNQVRTYSAPGQVAMNETSSNTRLIGSTTSIDAGFSTFVLRTNTSVTFTANWTARFEYSQLNAVSTHYIAKNGYTLWNASFSTAAKPTNPYTWYNLTFRVSQIPQYWSQTSPPTNITNIQDYPSSFSSGAGYYLINQTDLTSWLSNSWLIMAKSSYKISASMPSQVVAGLPLTVSITTIPYSNSWCNISFFDHLDDIEYTKNVTVTGSSYQLTLKLNRSDTYAIFLFDRWTGGNEGSLNNTLTIDVVEPLCNLTEVSINPLVLGNPATAQFKFLNGTAGWVAMQPIVVMINGTSRSFTYAGGMVTVSWSTASGGWRSGSNHVNITSVSGVYINFTVASFTITPPDAILTLNATSYAAIYADSIPIRFTFLNLTGGTPQPFPAPPTLYRNGTMVTFTTGGGGSYVYIIDTNMFPQAGAFHLNFTAKYLAYNAINITTVILSKIPMDLSIQTPQTSVTIGSSLSVSAVLNYGNGTPAHEGFSLQFNFIVTYTNGSIRTISKNEVVNNGVASSSLLATSDMKSISVNATYAGNGIRASATTDLISDIQVVAPQGLSLMTIMIIGGGGGALVVALVGIAKYRGARKRTEVRKTKALVQTASLAQLIVVHLASGRALYSRSIGSEGSADPNLISGFLSANQSIISEVFKKQPGAGLKFADYGEYKVVSNVGNNVMATLFCTETAGEELQSVLQSFTDKFEKKYAVALKSWDGNMNVFKDADDIADEVFSMPLCSPYMLLEVPISKLSKDERAAVHTARILSAERGVFFMPRVVDFLLTKQGLKRGKAMDVIDSLTKKGVFRQLTIEQAAQVVKSTTEKAGDQS